MVRVAGHGRMPSRPLVRDDPVDDEYVLDESDVLGISSHAKIVGCTHKATGTRRACKVIDISIYPSSLDINTEILLYNLGSGAPGIVELIDVFVDDKRVAMVMELMDGGELFSLVESEGCLQEEAARAATRAILTGLVPLHNTNIVHGDVKLENMLMKKGAGVASVKLCDFGSALLLEDDAASQPITGFTPNYVAPEVLRGEGVRLSVDLWSLGVAVYIMLCGYPPFLGADDDQAAHFRAILAGDLEFDDEDWDDVSASAKDFIRGLLQGDPLKRPTAEAALAHPWLAAAS